MRIILLSTLVLFLLDPTAIFAQQTDLKSLQSSLKTAQGQERVDILNILSEKLKNTQPKQAKKYAEDALKLSTDINYPQGIITSGFFLGIVERDRGKINRALNATEAGIAAARSLQNPQLELEGLKILRAIAIKEGNTQRMEEIELASKRLTNTIALQQRNQEYSNLNQQYKEKEKDLEELAADNTRISSENKKMEEDLRLTEIATLKEKAKVDSLEKVQVGLELQAVQAEKSKLETEAQLKRQQHIQTLLLFGIIVAILGFGGLFQYFRLKRIRDAEKIKSQRQLMMQEKMAALGQLTAGMAHEIQNPLNFVNNFAEGSKEMAKELEELLTEIEAKPKPDQLQVCKELTTDLRQNSTDIIENGQRINRIVRSMMEHAKGNKGKIESTDINELVQQSLNLAYHGYVGLHPDFKATLEENYDNSLGKVEVITQDLSRVFLNIFGNACYALHQKQKRQSEAFQATLSVRTKTYENGVAILIRDNGPGIPEDIQKKIFTPFFSTKPTEDGNTGLGLSISYDIVVQGHHGKLEVRSQPDIFTEFLVVLPR